MILKSSLSRRGWAPCLHKQTGKFFTGEHNHRVIESIHGISASRFPCDYEETVQPHGTQHLWLRPRKIFQTRTSSKIVFEDTDGFEYKVSLNPAMEIIKEGFDNSANGFVFVEVAQIKKGSVVGIEMVKGEDEDDS